MFKQFFLVSKCAHPVPLLLIKQKKKNLIIIVLWLHRLVVSDWQQNERKHRFPICLLLPNMHSFPHYQDPLQLCCDWKERDTWSSFQSWYRAPNSWIWNDRSILCHSLGVPSEESEFLLIRWLRLGLLNSLGMKLVTQKIKWLEIRNFQSYLILSILEGKRG